MRSELRLALIWAGNLLTEGDTNGLTAQGAVEMVFMGCRFTTLELQAGRSGECQVAMDSG